MSTYRVGDHHGVTIVREGDGARCDRPDHDCDRGHLVGVMLTAEDAALVVEAMNAPRVVTHGRMEPNGPAIGTAHRRLADSCTCDVLAPKPDPTCIVHQGRRARGPKPPPLGPGCICDGSGRTCPRHGAVM